MLPLLLLHSGLTMHSLAPSPRASLHGLARSPRASLRVAMCAPEEPPPAPVAPAEPAAPAPLFPNERTYDSAEEKALRAVRKAFGGYPEGKYYKIESEEGETAGYAQVRTDYPVLGAWSDAEIKDTKSSLKSTTAEILIDTPIGPFIVLSAIAIWRDGLSAWGIPPCRDYVDFCAAGLVPDGNMLFFK